MQRKFFKKERNQLISYLENHLIHVQTTLERAQLMHVKRTGNFVLGHIEQRHIYSYPNKNQFSIGRKSAARIHLPNRQEDDKRKRGRFWRSIKINNHILGLPILAEFETLQCLFKSCH